MSNKERTIELINNIIDDYTVDMMDETMLRPNSVIIKLNEIKESVLSIKEQKKRTIKCE